MTQEEKVKWLFRTHASEADARLTAFQATQTPDPESLMVIKLRLPEGHSVVGPIDAPPAWYAGVVEEQLAMARAEGKPLPLPGHPDGGVPDSKTELRPEDRPGVILPLLREASLRRCNINP